MRKPPNILPRPHQRLLLMALSELLRHNSSTQTHTPSLRNSSDRVLTSLGHNPHIGKWVDLRFGDTATCGRWAARARVSRRSMPRLNPELLRQLRVLHLSLLQDGDAGRGRKCCLREKLKAPPRQSAICLLGRNRICQRQSHDFRVCLAHVRRSCAIPLIVVLISA